MDGDLYKNIHHPDNDVKKGDENQSLQDLERHTREMFTVMDIDYSQLQNITIDIWYCDHVITRHHF